MAPAWLLFFLAPVVAEYLLGDLTIRMLAPLVALGPLYGGGALLIREISRRAGRGWPTIVLLAIAYAVTEESFLTQSLFNPDYVHQRLLDYGYIPMLGTSLNWTVFVLSIHVVWSVATPILIAEGFAAIGAKTTLLPGGEVFSALEKGTVDAADYTGPAVNWDLGFQQVSKYIWTGPPGLESVYQPVDLMDLVVRMDVWNKLSPKMKNWVDEEVQIYSNVHHAAIQKADMEAWGKFEKAGVQINRLPAEDLPKFQRVAVPIWFKWANKDKDAAKIFKLQLDVMESHTCGYVTPDMYKGLKIDV